MIIPSQDGRCYDADSDIFTLNVTDCPKTTGLDPDETVVVVAAWPIVCVGVADVLLVTLLSPLYFAVIEWEAMANEESEGCAPFLDTGLEPRATAPSRNVIVPVALPPNAGCIVAERTTVWPKTAGFGLDDTVVALEAAFTLCGRPVDVLPVR